MHRKFTKPACGQIFRYPDTLIITHDVPVDPRYVEVPATPLQDRFSRGNKCILLVQQQYGELATIKGVKVANANARLDVQCDSFRGDKTFRDLNIFCSSVETRMSKQRYRAAHEVAQLVGMSPIILSRLLSVITVKDPDDPSVVYSVGLALKFARRELMVPGFSRRIVIETKERGVQHKWQCVAALYLSSSLSRIGEVDRPDLQVFRGCHPNHS